MANDPTSTTDDAMAREMGLDDQSLERRHKAVGLAPEDLVRIARIRESIARNAEEFTSAFFAYLGTLEEARDFMRNREAVERARRLKVDHLLALAGGQYGMEYAQQRVRLGRLYSRAGLETRLFLGAFHHLLHLVGATILKGARSPDEAFEDQFLLFGRKPEQR